MYFYKVSSWKLFDKFIMFFRGRCGKYDPAKTKEKSENGNGVIAKEGPLFDELSIPFIDASPTNTPRMGRSVERLGSFFKGSIGRSRGSLSSKTIIRVNLCCLFISFFIILF